MRALFGIAELHNIRASPMQAARRAAVSSSCANAAVGSTPTSKPATATIPLRIPIITISQGMDTRCVRLGPFSHWKAVIAITFVRFFCRREGSE